MQVQRSTGDATALLIFLAHVTSEASSLLEGGQSRSSNVVIARPTSSTGEAALPITLPTQVQQLQHSVIRPSLGTHRRCRSLNSVLCHLVEVPVTNPAIQVAVQSNQVVEFSYRSRPAQPLPRSTRTTVANTLGNTSACSSPRPTKTV